MSQIIVYRSDDAGAPELCGSYTSGKNTLDQLIEIVCGYGYGSKPSIESLFESDKGDFYNAADGMLYFGRQHGLKGAQVVTKDIDASMPSSAIAVRLFDTAGRNVDFSVDGLDIAMSPYGSSYLSTGTDACRIYASATEDTSTRPWIIIGDVYGLMIITFPESNGTTIPANNPGTINYIGFTSSIIGETTYHSVPVVAIGHNCPSDSSLGWNQYDMTHALSPFNKNEKLSLVENGSPSSYSDYVKGLNPLGSGCIANGAQGSFLEYSKITDIVRSSEFGVQVCADGGNGTAFFYRGLRQLSKASSMQNLSPVNGSGSDDGESFIAIRFRAKSSEEIQTFLVQTSSWPYVAGLEKGVAFTTHNANHMPVGYSSHTAQIDDEFPNVLKRRTFALLSRMEEIATRRSSGVLSNPLVHCICPSFDKGIIHPKTNTVYSDDFQLLPNLDSSLNKYYAKPIGYTAQHTKLFDSSMDGFTYIAVIRIPEDTGPFSLAHIQPNYATPGVLESTISIDIDDGYANDGSPSYSTISMREYDNTGTKRRETRTQISASNSFGQGLSGVVPRNEAKLLIVRKSTAIEGVSDVFVDGIYAGSCQGENYTSIGYNQQRIIFPSNNVDIAFSAVVNGLISMTDVMRLSSAWIDGKSDMLFMHSNIAYEKYVRGDFGDLFVWHDCPSRPELNTYKARFNLGAFAGDWSFKSKAFSDETFSGISISFDVATLPEYNGESVFGMWLDIFKPEHRLLSMQRNNDGSLVLGYGDVNEFGPFNAVLLADIANPFDDATKYGDEYRPDFALSGGRVEITIKDGNLHLSLFKRNNMAVPFIEYDVAYPHSFKDFEVAFGRDGFIFPDEIGDYGEFDYTKKNSVALSNLMIRRVR